MEDWHLCLICYLPYTLFTRRICSEPGPDLVRSKCLDEHIWFAPKFWNGPTWPGT